MSEILTITMVEKWIYEKLNNNKNPPKGWEEQINNSIRMKEELIKKETNFDKTEIEVQITHLKELKYFLNKEDFEIPFEINPAGLLISGLIIEPISSYKYFYNLCGLRGVVQLQMVPETKRWYMEVEGHQIFLKGQPIEKFAYQLPNEEMIKKLMNNQIKVPTTQELWDKVEKYYRTFLDIPESSYKILTLFTFQTWLQDLLPTVFYMSILGGWGAGKTQILESAANLSCRGMLGNASTAVIARMIDEQRVRIFIDELDSKTGEEDSELLSIIRIGYRKGQKYIRMSQTMTIQQFEIFGCKGFTAHTQFEPALLQRSLPITTVESTDATLPAINSVNKEYSIKVYNSLFLWYLNNILYIVDNVRCVDYIEDGGRNDIYSKLVSSHPPFLWESTGNTEQRYGRFAELGFVMAKICKMLGINLSVTTVNDIFETKKQVEDEQSDIGPKRILRDILVEKYKELAVLSEGQGYRTPSNDVKIANKEIYDIFNNKLKNDKSYGVSPADFVGYLRELGFDAEGRKKLRIKMPNEVIGIEGWPVRLALIYTPIVLKKLGIEAIESVKIEQEKIKKEYKGDYKEDE